MYKVLTDDGKRMDMTKIVDLISKSVKLFNGWINPSNHCTKVVVFEEPEDDPAYDENTDTNIIATAGWTTIYIKAYNYMIDVEKTKEKMMIKSLRTFDTAMATMIVGNVAHELSHLQQDKSKYVVLDEKTKKMYHDIATMEYCNEWRIECFLVNNEEKIAKKLWNRKRLNINLYIMCSRYFQKFKWPKDITFYEVSKREDVIDDILAYMSGLSNKDFKNLYKANRIKKKKFMVQINKRWVIDPYEYDAFLMLEEIIFYSNKLFETGLYVNPSAGALLCIRDGGKTDKNFPFQIKCIRDVPYNEFYNNSTGLQVPESAISA